MKNILADRTNLIDSSGIRKVFALAASLENPINFSIGQPDFDVPEKAKIAAIKAIEHGQNKYSQTSGDKMLLDAITNQVTESYGWPDPNVLITSGVSGGLLLAFLSLINPGDEVITTDPYFVIYKHVINLIGGKCVFIDTYPDFRLSADAVAQAVTEKTKLIVMNSPANPTGMVYSEQELKAVAKVAADNDLLVMSDEIYDKFSYDMPCPSIAHSYDKTLLLKGYSKTYAMTGWRLGYVAGTEKVKHVIEQMTKIQQYTFVCAPTPFQKAAVAALECETEDYVHAYRKKRDLLYDGLKDKFELAKPGGAFYAFVKAPNWAKSATEFVEKAITNNVLVIPGCVFSEKDTHFRISYATSDEKIRQGVDILCELADGP